MKKTSNNSGKRPSRPATKSAGRPAGRTSGKPAGRPSGKPGAKPYGSKPDSKSGPRKTAGARGGKSGPKRDDKRQTYSRDSARDESRQFEQPGERKFERKPFKRPDRSEGRAGARANSRTSSRPERAERGGERGSKPAYGKTFEQKFPQRGREERPERSERPARYERSERPSRDGERPQRGAGARSAPRTGERSSYKPREERGGFERKSYDRPQRSDRPERSARFERAERPQRNERGGERKTFGKPFFRKDAPRTTERDESRVEGRQIGRATRKPGFDKDAPKAEKPTVRFGVKPAAAPHKPEAEKVESAHEGERIAKRLARAGVASRREIERMIAARRVKVNGRVIDSPALNVTDKDIIIVDGNIIAEREPTMLYRYHKPAGIVTTASDPQGRPTVFEQLPKELGRVISVGRLDLNTEGLLLLTNNGELSRYLELPSTGWTRRYRVRVHGVVDPKKLELLAQGVEYDGVQYGPVIATIEQAQDRANVWIDVAIKEGKNREIRNVMRAIDLEVNRLIRVSYGPFQLGHLPSGAVEAVPARVLRGQFGKVLEL